MASFLPRPPSARRLLALLPSTQSTAHASAASSAWRWRAPMTASRATLIQHQTRGIPTTGVARKFSVRPPNRGVFRPWLAASEEDALEYRDMYLEAPLHRSVGKDDMNKSCRVGGRRLTAEEIEAMGYRVQNSFARELEAQAAEQEIQAHVKAYGHGMTYRGEPKRAEEGDHALVCWGRQETDLEEQTLSVAPWGSGASFNPERIPPATMALINRIQTCGHFAVGPVVDLSMSQTSGMGNSEPWSQPAVNGDVVVLVNLGSDNIFTLTPSYETRRMDPVLAAVLSWTDYDIDVLLKDRSLLVLSGSSLREWRYGIRAGLVAEFKGGASGVCDWWGTTDCLLRRGKSRMMITVGFMAPEISSGRW